MQNDETNFPAQETNNGYLRQVKGCLLLITTTILVLFALAIAAAAGIIIVDSVTLRGEEYTLERRVQRYKVACQFLWYDFKDFVSGKKSDSSQEDEP
jgi:hypothetical protein